MVSGFHVSPRWLTKDREISGQSVSGAAAVCAANVPVAPLSLPRNSVSATRCTWRPRRCANTASSLPRVVGVAGWPWVWDSMGVAFASRAIVATAATSSRAAGNHTWLIASRMPSA